ncbi:UNVERIFIED_CONTAM: hypothetical protein GTU68_057508 [Idotea baltica]|nr:hypothetical protein [Idotea baltica]
MRGNIENPIGSVQMPLGVAGPLQVNGDYAQGRFYVPLATTEGALVRSYERGMLITARAGGVHTRVCEDENCLVPVFRLSSLPEAHTFADSIEQRFEQIRAVADDTTNFGQLLRIEPRIIGSRVYLRFCYDTADAHGMNMITRATHAACEWISAEFDLGRYQVITGMSSEKRASGTLFESRKGKRVVAQSIIPAEVLRTHLRVSPQSMMDMWHNTLVAQIHANTVGYNGHFANGLTALFVACGQDVANVANSSVGITSFDLTPDDELSISITLPSLTVATVGGGTALGTSRECLQMLDCFGSGKSKKLAEICAATVLCGELSMGAAIASGEFADAHQQYGRNHPGRNHPAPAETKS